MEAMLATLFGPPTGEVLKPGNKQRQGKSHPEPYQSHAPTGLVSRRRLLPEVQAAFLAVFEPGFPLNLFHEGE